MYGNHINPEREGGMRRERLIERPKEILRSSQCADSDWGRSSILWVFLFRLLPPQTANLICWEQDRALFLCQQISLSNISSTIKGVTGRKWWIQIVILKMKVLKKQNGYCVCVGGCLCAWVYAFVHVHNLIFATLVPSHLTDRIYITHLNFHYFSWKDFVIGFFPTEFLSPHLPKRRGILLNYCTFWNS